MKAAVLRIRKYRDNELFRNHLKISTGLRCLLRFSTTGGIGAVTQVTLIRDSERERADHVALPRITGLTSWYLTAGWAGNAPYRGILAKCEVQRGYPSFRTVHAALTRCFTDSSPSALGASTVATRLQKDPSYMQADSHARVARYRRLHQRA